MAGRNYQLAKAICEGIFEVDSKLILFALSGSQMIEAARNVGLRTASEVFADRAYEEDGSLVSRSKPGALITDEAEAVKRAVRMANEGKVTSVTGKDIDIKADSVCVHSDNANALRLVRKIRSSLIDSGIRILPPS